MRIDMGYGKTMQSVMIPDENLLDVLTPNPFEYGLQGEAEIERALKEPIGSPRLGEIINPGEKIAIITSDITRPMPTAQVMPPLLDELFAVGVDPADVTLYFALGIHRKHTVEEQRKLAGERAWSEVRCVDGDVSRFKHFGKTKNGTPVDIVEEVAAADHRICLGNIEYHYFAGYSGGSKAIMPGLSTHEAIQSNHRLMVEENACAGELDNNPLRIDIEESGQMVGIDFIVNVVLDEHKKIIRAFAGDSVQAHRSGCRFLDGIYVKEISNRADIVVVSQGGAPKDLNLYQTQKALDNAKHAVKKGGIVILIGSCLEGLGEPVFEEWMLHSQSPQSMITRIKSDFQLGGHKAAAIAMVLENADIFLVSDMDPSFVSKIFLIPFASAQAALEEAFIRLGAEATVIAMPYGGSTLPRLKKQ